MPKIYKYQKGEAWSGHHELSEILYMGLPEDTLVWWEGLCPNNEPAERCSHCMTIKKIRSDRSIQAPAIPPQNQTAPNPKPEPDNKGPKIKYLSWVFGVLALALVVFAVIALYPYIFDNSKGQEKKKEKIDQEIKIDIEKLTVELRSTKETEYYEVKKIPNPEIIEDIKGDYFVVDLKIAQRNEKVLFSSGEYVIEDLNEEFVNALGKFMDEVYNKLDKGVECRLYVKGSADIAGQETFKKSIDNRFGAEEGFTTIEYLKAIEGSKSLFSQTKQLQSIGSEYTNTDLPNLRGKFIQFKITQNYKNIRPTILQGSVEGTKPDEKLRNAYLFLYVNWEKKKYLD